MRKTYPVETLRGAAATNELHIVTLIANLTRSADILAVDIEHEEERAGVRDILSPTYPVLARSLRARRDNILATVTQLEARIPGKSKAALTSDMMASA